MGDDLGAPGLALAFVWAGLAVMPGGIERAALGTGALFAAFFHPTADGQWITLALALGAVAVAVLPVGIRRNAGPLGAVVAMAATLWISYPGAAEQAGRGDLWVLGLTALACLAVATLAAVPRISSGPIRNGP